MTVCVPSSSFDFVNRVRDTERSPPQQHPLLDILGSILATTCAHVANGTSTT
jgi:hypothetical protein